jgi:glutaminyl-tRNA synthetase
VFYLAAEKLIRQGDAYVCDLSAEDVRAYRGTLTEPGRNSPYRERSVGENLDLFRRMRAGEFADGARTLRAKIDMASGNINLRDPALYRIKHVEHQNTGAAWCIYPMYDYAHSLSDAVEGITHSLCTLEFEDHRPLYDWCVDKVDLANNSDLLQPLLDAGLPNQAAKPRQIEFSRLNLNYLVMSKRKLHGAGAGEPGRRLGRSAHADPAGRAPPRLHPAAHCACWSTACRHQQAELGDRHSRCWKAACAMTWTPRAPRRMAVIDPLKLVLTNLP